MKSRRIYTKLLKVLPLGKRINSEGKAQKLNFIFHIYHSQLLHTLSNMLGGVLHGLQILTHLIIRKMYTNMSLIYR